MLVCVAFMLGKRKPKSLTAHSGILESFDPATNVGCVSVVALAHRLDGSARTEILYFRNMPMVVPVNSEEFLIKFPPSVGDQCLIIEDKLHPGKWLWVPGVLR
jgi:hypothetical protein